MRKPTKKQMEKLHKQLCAELGIPSTKITLNAEGSDSCGWFSNYTFRIYVHPTGSLGFYPWKPRSWKWVMAHETYHWWQHVTGLLDADQYKGVDKDEYKETGSWSTWPWERAANRFADKMVAEKGWKC